MYLIYYGGDEIIIENCQFHVIQKIKLQTKLIQNKHVIIVTVKKMSPSSLKFYLVLHRANPQCGFNTPNSRRWAKVTRHHRQLTYDRPPPTSCQSAVRSDRLLRPMWWSVCTQSGGQTSACKDDPIKLILLVLDERNEKTLVLFWRSTLLR